MSTFGLGTFPAMATLMLSRNLFSPAFRGKLRAAVPVFLCITASLLIIRGLALDIPYLSPAADAAGHVHDCCRK
jgi:sulfite exporter TauE/SafE